MSNGARTRDIVDHNHALYLLSYTHHSSSDKLDSFLRHGSGTRTHGHRLMRAALYLLSYPAWCTMTSEAVFI